MSKSEQLTKLYSAYKNEFLNEEIVLGDGNPDSRLLLIGEAPGKDEVNQSRPFVGMAGKNLAEFLGILGIDRQLLYITNTIKYRLSQLNGQTGRAVNRPATKNDIAINREYLLNEIDIIKPEYIVTLGNVPLKAVTGDYKSSVGRVHGQLAEIECLALKYHLFPLYHPASIIYNASLKTSYIEDIERLRGIIG